VTATRGVLTEHSRTIVRACRSEPSHNSAVK
jgi:hypothetical protein